MAQYLTAISNYAVTSRCNGRCTTCNIWKTEPTEAPSLEEITEFFIENRDYLKKLEFIQLTGGEPFLRDDLPEIAKVVQEVAPKCMIWFPTNGLLPEKIYDTVLQMIASNWNQRIGVTVSLDGEGEIHDIQRGIDGSYKKAIQTIKLLGKIKKDNPLTLSTGFTLTKDNYKHAPVIQKISYRYGADFSFRPINISEHYYQNLGENGNLTEEMFPFLDALAYTLKKEKGVLKNLTNLAYIQGAKEYINDKRTLSCSAAEESVFIDTYGDVYPCIVMNHKLGNIHDNSLKDILSSPSAHEAREIISRLGCPTCWLECEVYRDIKKDWGRLLKAIL